MKKTFSLVLSLLLILSLFTGSMCYAEAETSEETSVNTAVDEAAETESDTQDQTSEGARHEKLSKSKILEMSNYMNGNGIERSGKWIARWAYDNGKLRMRIINSVSGESVMAGANAQPYHMIADRYYMIYLSSTQQHGQAEIRRVRVSGGQDEKLIDVAKTGAQGEIDFLFQYQDHLYFTVNNEKTSPISGTFFMADLDGENIVPVLEKAIYYPYIINDRLYYQDDNDYSRLHVCNLDGTDDKLLIDDVVFDYYTDGINFYYRSLDGIAEWDENAKLQNGADLKYCMKVFNPGNETKVIPEINSDVVAFDGNTIYYADEYDDGRLYTYDTVTNAIDVLCIRDYIADLVFYDASTLLCIDGSKSGLEDVFFMNLDGSGIRQAS